jgi:hypothetical protein
MNIWFKLSSNQATDFQVPHAISTAPEASFYSTMPLSNLYHSGPWLLLSFQRVQERPFIATFQPSTIELSHINEFESFNPLSTAQCGKLELNRREIDGLVELLVNYADQMPNGHVRPHATFEEIEPEQWENFRIFAHPAQSVRQRMFLQVQDPASDMRDESIVSLVVVSNHPDFVTQPSGKQYQIAFRQFNVSQLSDPLFSPLHQAASRIDLDKYGMVELAMLLQKVLGNHFHSPVHDDRLRPFPFPNAFPISNNYASMLV